MKEKITKREIIHKTFNFLVWLLWGFAVVKMGLFCYHIDYHRGLMGDPCSAKTYYMKYTAKEQQRNIKPKSTVYRIVYTPKPNLLNEEETKKVLVKIIRNVLKASMTIGCIFFLYQQRFLRNTEVWVDFLIGIGFAYLFIFVTPVVALLQWEAASTAPSKIAFESYDNRFSSSEEIWRTIPSMVQLYAMVGFFVSWAWQLLFLYLPEFAFRELIVSATEVLVYFYFSRNISNVLDSRSYFNRRLLDASLKAYYMTIINMIQKIFI